MEKIDYPSDLTDEQWHFVKQYLPKPKPKGRPIKTDMRSVVNAILYINRTGCQWRFIPKTYSPKSTVYGYFRLWQENGTWDCILRELVRIK